MEMFFSFRNISYMVWKICILTAFLLEAFLVMAENQPPINNGPLGDMIELIIGGRVAQPGSTPWLASLKDNQYDTPVHFCGGAIISNHWVLTAARCIIGYDPPYFDVMVVLGEYDLNEEDEYWESQKLIVQVVIHPDYDYFTHNYDIALLRVFPSIDFNSRIQPLPLPPDYHDDAPIRPPGSTKELDFVAKVFDNESHLKKDTNGHGILLKNKKPDPCSSDVNDRTHHMQSNSLGYIAGWGRTEENGDLANLVHEAYVPILDNDICQAIYPGFDASVMMCAGNITHGGVDPCWGDWGGPMVDNHGSLSGIASWAVGCGRQGFPAVYVNAIVVRDWICDIMSFDDD